MVREPENKKLIDSLTLILKRRWDNFMKEYSMPTDKKVVPAMMALYRENVSADNLPDIYKLIGTKYKNDINRFTNEMFAKSIFTDSTRMKAFIKNPTRQALEKDLAFKTALSVMDIYRKSYYGTDAFDADFETGHRMYIAGLLEMQPQKKFYPDANFTMRMTYGTVQSYNARDAVNYDYMTTMKGIMEKEDPNNWEFVVPEKLKALYEKKDFGDYAKDGVMPVCFITNNDITGGNSGSPVIDGEGNLIGLVFDGNWEAMSSNIAFEPALQRCICVDIRYVLFVMDKYAGASHLVNEMKIIK